MNLCSINEFPLITNQQDLAEFLLQYHAINTLGMGDCPNLTNWIESLKHNQIGQAEINYNEHIKELQIDIYNSRLRYFYNKYHITSFRYYGITNNITKEWEGITVLIDINSYQ